MGKIYGTQKEVGGENFKGEPWVLSAMLTPGGRGWVLLFEACIWWVQVLQVWLDDTVVESETTLRDLRHCKGL